MTQLSLWRRSAIARSAARTAAALPVSKAASGPEAAGSAAVAGGVGRKPFGTGGPLLQSGPDEPESDGEQGLVIEAKPEKARLPRWS